MHKFIAGIDPDVEKSGLAIWATESKTWLLCKAIENENLIESISKICDPASTVILLEAGWMVKKSNYRKTSGRRVSEAISRKVGQNQGAGQMIGKLLQKHGYQVEEIRPLVKGALKKNGKWTLSGKKFIQENTGITRRMNDEERDALFLVIISNKRPLFK